MTDHLSPRLSAPRLQKLAQLGVCIWGCYDACQSGLFRPLVLAALVCLAGHLTNSGQKTSHQEVEVIKICFDSFTEHQYENQN